MMAAANRGNLSISRVSEYYVAYLRVYIREYEQAEALAAHALELAERHQFPNPAARSRVALGQARASSVAREWR